MKTDRKIIAFLAALVLITGTVVASEPPRFPLIWQARSVSNADGAEVTRLHDPEAGVNCYVVKGQTDYHEYTRTFAISCVKVR